MDVVVDDDYDFIPGTPPHKKVMRAINVLCANLDLHCLDSSVACHVHNPLDLQQRVREYRV